MWENEEGCGYVLSYIINNHPVCTILDGFMESSSKKYTALVYNPKASYPDNYINPVYIEDNSLEVMKLKCLIAMKESGYTIEKITV